jgi:hypothetical protein
MRTSFEQKAHDIQYRKKYGQEHPHEIETYTSEEGLGWEKPLIVIIAILTTIILIAEYTGGTDAIIQSFN